MDGAKLPNINKSKTEVVVFESSGASLVSSTDLDFSQPYVKPVVTNLGVKIDSQ